MSTFSSRGRLAVLAGTGVMFVGLVAMRGGISGRADGGAQGCNAEAPTAAAPDLPAYAYKLMEANGMSEADIELVAAGEGYAPTYAMAAVGRAYDLAELAALQIDQGTADYAGHAVPFADDIGECFGASTSDLALAQVLTGGRCAHWFDGTDSALVVSVQACMQPGVVDALALEIRASGVQHWVLPCDELPAAYRPTTDTLQACLRSVSPIAGVYIEAKRFEDASPAVDELAVACLTADEDGGASLEAAKADLLDDEATLTLDPTGLSEVRELVARFDLEALHTDSVHPRAEGGAK